MHDETPTNAETFTFVGDLTILSSIIRVNIEFKVENLMTPDNCMWEITSITPTEAGDEDKVPAPDWLIQIVSNDEDIAESIDMIIDKAYAERSNATPTTAE